MCMHTHTHTHHWMKVFGVHKACSEAANCSCSWLMKNNFSSCNWRSGQNTMRAISDGFFEKDTADPGRPGQQLHVMLPMPNTKNAATIKCFIFNFYQVVCTFSMGHFMATCRICPSLKWHKTKCVIIVCLVQSCSVHVLW